MQGLGKLTDEIDGQSAIRAAARGMPKEGHPVRRLYYREQRRRATAAEEGGEVAGVNVGVAEATNGGVAVLDRLRDATE
jgi:hypothetical protein